MPLPTERREYPIGVQQVFPLGTTAQPVLCFSDAVLRDVTTGIYGTTTPLSGASAPAWGVSILGLPVFELSATGATFVQPGVGINGVQYTWPATGGTLGSILQSSGGLTPTLSWLGSGVAVEVIDGRLIQYFSDPLVRRLLEDILTVLRAETLNTAQALPDAVGSEAV